MFKMGFANGAELHKNKRMLMFFLWASGVIFVSFEEAGRTCLTNDAQTRIKINVFSMLLAAEP